jgi:hypothetical protein
MLRGSESRFGYKDEIAQGNEDRFGASRQESAGGAIVAGEATG